MDRNMELGSAAVAGAASAAAAKGAGGAAIGGAVGGGLALGAILVMLMKKPRSEREWAVALISTAASSLGGGAALMLYLGLHKILASDVPIELYLGLMQLGGVFLACSLPGWLLVRVAFNTMAKYQDKGADDVYRDVKGMLP